VSELEEFVRRELELKRTLPFRDWLRHAVGNYETVLHMLITSPKPDRPLRVEVLDRKGDGLTVAVYELPGDCRRALVDVQQVQGSVWGFCPTAQPGQERQVNATLVSKEFDALQG
jgi:hypothetical protein